jgi:hypothetical protein
MFKKISTETDIFAKIFTNMHILQNKFSQIFVKIDEISQISCYHSNDIGIFVIGKNDLLA